MLLWAHRACPGARIRLVRAVNSTCFPSGCFWGVPCHHALAMRLHFWFQGRRTRAQCPRTSRGESGVIAPGPYSVASMPPVCCTGVRYISFWGGIFGISHVSVTHSTLHQEVGVLEPTALLPLRGTSTTTENTHACWLQECSRGARAVRRRVCGVLQRLWAHQRHDGFGRLRAWAAASRSA